MVNETVEKHILDLFGLQGLRPGPHKTKDRAEFRVISFWIADISFFNPAERLVVGIMKSKTWSKGFIIFNRLDRESSLISYVAPSTAIDVTDWDDPVTLALGCVDLINHQTDFVSYGRGVYSYRLMVATEASYTSMDFSGAPSIPSIQMQQLWKALLTTVYYLSDTYADPDMQQLVNPKRGLYFGHDNR